MSPILYKWINYPIGSQECGSGSQGRGQAEGLDLRLLYKTWLDPWWWLRTEPWACLCWEGRWRQGDRGESKGTSKPEKREMVAACGSRAILTPSSISEATMKSLLMWWESLLRIWGNCSASHTEMLFSCQWEWEDACLQNCLSLKNNIMAVATKWVWHLTITWLI